MMIAAEGYAMVDELTADEIRTLLRLEPHATCGSVRVTYLSPQSIAAGGLPPFSDPRPMGSALYFMVTPTAPVQLHRIRNDQLYHYYLGDPLEVLLLRSDGTSGGTFHTARVMGRRRWFLGASTEWPGVVPADVEIGKLEELAAKYSSIATDLRAIAASVRPDRGSA
jgi:predicted cupin superfamily sugar epimerase